VSINAVANGVYARTPLLARQASPRNLRTNQRFVFPPSAGPPS
jgi:hypothetical protein